jgi:hypothetical protein
MFAAMRTAGRPVELHIFQSGGHSWGMGRSGSEVAGWPALFAAWARTIGVLPSQGAQSAAGSRGE